MIIQVESEVLTVNLDLSNNPVAVNVSNSPTQVNVAMPGTGATGPAGADGAPGAPGADGADGLSAYEIAVNNGFVGDETAWLASLQGPPGANGSDGADGISSVAKKEKLTFDATDIANQYKDFLYLAETDSVKVSLNGVEQYEGIDESYTLSTVGGVTRMTLRNALATGGDYALVNGSIIHVSYRH